MNKDDGENTKYKVVMNYEEQYSIWAVDRPNPRGWHEAGRSGAKSECLAYIKEVWTDMRPLSLRNKVEKSPIILQNSGVHLNGNQMKAIGTD